MAEVVNTTDMEVDCHVQDGGSPQDDYTIPPKESISIEVENATMTFYGPDGMASNSVLDVQETNTVEVVWLAQVQRLAATKQT